MRENLTEQSFSILKSALGEDSSGLSPNKISMNYEDYDGINEINNVIDGLVEESQQQIAENTETPSVSFIAGVVVPINPLQSNDPFTFFLDVDSYANLSQISLIYIGKSFIAKGGCSEDRDFGSVNVIVGSKHLYYTRDNLRTTRYFELSQSNLNLKKLNISLATDRIYYAQMGVVVNCELTKSAIYEWRLKTFNAIISAYEEAKAAYEEKMAEQEALGVQIKDSNPLFYRDIENTILRKNCISYLVDTQNDYGKDFYNLTANTGLFEQLKKYMPEYTRAEPKYFNGWNRKVVVVCNKLDNTNSIIKELKTKELPL